MAAIAADASLFRRMTMKNRKSYIYINEAMLDFFKKCLPTEDIEHSIDPAKGEVCVAIDSDEWGRWRKAFFRPRIVGKTKWKKRIGGSDWSKKS